MSIAKQLFSFFALDYGINFYVSDSEKFATLTRHNPKRISSRHTVKLVAGSVGD
ncbi:MAG: hypothetical protein L0Z53_05030 [Acidobacteriales bacterium]|nr:hypothetical protein [Terriglobales bacterium]